MASLNGQTIASSYEQLLHTDTDGGGNGNTLVTIKDGDNGTTFGLKLATNKVEVIPSAADDANAFEVSKNDGTAVFTVNSSTPSATLAGTLTATKTLSSDTQTTPETILTLGATYASTGTNGGAGSGSRIEFQIPDDETNPITGTAIAGIKESADDSDASAGMAFYVSQNDTTLDEVVRIDHDGKVGIGESSPDGRLEISDGLGQVSTGVYISNTRNANNNNFIRFRKSRQASGNDETIITSGDYLGQIEFQGADATNGYETGAVIYAVTEGTIGSNQIPTNLQFHTENTSGTLAERMRITANGNVGINDTSPSQKLSIDVNSSNTTQASFDGIEIGNSNTTANNGAAISFSYGAGGASHSRIGAVYSDRTGSSEDTHLFFGTLGSGGYGERMRITSDGNVGINTTVPGNATPAGSSQTYLSLDGGANGGVIEIMTSNNGNGEFIGGIDWCNNANADNTNVDADSKLLAFMRARTVTSDSNASDDSGGYIEFATKPEAGTIANRIVISSDGLVGIGTSAPGALLDVAATSNDDFPVKIRGNIDNDGGFTGIKFGYEADTGNYEKCAIKVEGTTGNVNPDFHILLNNAADSSDVSTDNTDSRLLLANDRDVHWNGKLSNPSANNGTFGGMTFLPNSVDRFMILLGSSSDNNNIDLIRFFAPAGIGSDVGSISTSGNQTNFETSSDYRLKENEVSLADGLTKLNQLKPYNFNWKIKPDEVVDGFFAHEVQEIVPFAVSGEKDRMETLKYEEADDIPEGKEIGDEYEVVHAQKLDHSKLVPLLVKAVQELSAKVEALENA